MADAAHLIVKLESEVPRSSLWVLLLLGPAAVPYIEVLTVSVGFGGGCRKLVSFGGPNQN